MIKVTFLGTSGQIPTAKKNHTSMLLTYGGENILVDCGEGTQRQMRKARINPCKITKILITHWHGDHVLGLMGLLQTLALSGYNKPLEIYGPKGFKEKMENLLYAFSFVKEYDLVVKEVTSAGKFFETKDFFIKAESMDHGTPCNAYSFTKIGKKRIDKDKLKKLNIPAGPHLQTLKEGKSIKLDGKKYLAKDLTYVEENFKVSFVLDTAFNPRIVPFVRNSDFLVCEASFHSDLILKAKEHNHMTAKQAGDVAKKSKSKKLFLTHISQRYENNLKSILDDAKTSFEETSLANDLEVVELC